ncbi:hypothetical protein CEXT_616071 [Caerostris extrusa]|uniref:Uncharacterized protein n=1 Tax=Caerostris extrusa TaxID=172846 RepID=A0AAV4SHV1_CAEEX|nr:hypothetical protein CEXT_616071 [Caerostris extrusa]
MAKKKKRQISTVVPLSLSSLIQRALYFNLSDSSFPRQHTNTLGEEGSGFPSPVYFRPISLVILINHFRTISRLLIRPPSVLLFACGRHPVCPTFRSSTLTPYLPETEGVCRPPMVIDIRGFFKYIAIEKQVDLGSGHSHSTGVGHLRFGRACSILGCFLALETSSLSLWLKKLTVVFCQ